MNALGADVDKRSAAIQSVKIAIDAEADVAARVPNGAVYLEQAANAKPPSITFIITDDPVRRLFGGRQLFQAQISITSNVGRDEGAEGAESLNASVIEALDEIQIGVPGVFLGSTSLIDRGQAFRGDEAFSVTSIFRLNGR